MAFVPFAKALRDPRVHKFAASKFLSEAEFKKRVFREVRLTPSWARRAPGSATAGDLSTQVDVALAVAASFVAA